MKSNFKQSREGIRSEMRSKRRKTNMILNGLIALVLLLIIIVSVSIFSNDDAGKQRDSEVETKATNDVADKKETQTQSTVKQTNKASQKDESDSAEDTDKAKKEDATVVTEGGSENVQKTIINPHWEPVGTSQTGPNSSQSVDWDERVKALAYAIGADQGDLTVWYLSFDGGSTKSIGTITEKGNPQAYRVYLEWQDSDGWKPVKVEELIENDKVQQ